MKKIRLIPVLLLRNGWLVQSKGFRNYQNLGNPIWAVKRLSEWASDELIYLDISENDDYDLRRNDLAHPNRKTFMEIIADVAKMAFMPIAVGGKIRSLADIETRLSLGADKVTINTKPLEDPSFIGTAAKQFGSQCVVVSIDVKQIDGQYIVMSHGGKKATLRNVLEWAKQVESEGAGEIFLNSVDRDGAGTGFDLELINLVAGSVKIPVIACGGAGEWEHFSEVARSTTASAVAAANIFQHVDQSVYLAKKHMHDQKLNVRSPQFLTI